MTACWPNSFKLLRVTGHAQLQCTWPQHVHLAWSKTSRTHTCQIDTWLLQRRRWTASWLTWHERSRTPTACLNCSLLILSRPSVPAFMTFQSCICIHWCCLATQKKGYRIPMLDLDRFSVACRKKASLMA